jgi:hypothetical protein
MMWADVIKASVAVLKGDSALTTLLGGQHIYRNKTRSTIQTPGVYWSVLWGDVWENLAPVTVQWDVFAYDANSSAAIELRLYELLHTDTVKEFDGLLMYSWFLGRFDFHDENQNLVHSAVEFKHLPPRHNG